MKSMGYSIEDIQRDKQRMLGLLDAGGKRYRLAWASERYFTGDFERTDTRFYIRGDGIRSKVVETRLTWIIGGSVEEPTTAFWDGRENIVNAIRTLARVRQQILDGDGLVDGCETVQAWLQQARPVSERTANHNYAIKTIMGWRY